MLLLVHHELNGKLPQLEKLDEILIFEYLQIVFAQLRHGNIGKQPLKQGHVFFQD